MAAESCFTLTVTSTQVSFSRVSHMALAHVEAVRARRHIQAVSRKANLMVMERFTAKMAIFLRALSRMGCLMARIAEKGSLMAAPSLGFSHRGRKMDLVY